jgi:hypothetical protein
MDRSNYFAIGFAVGVLVMGAVAAVIVGDSQKACKQQKNSDPITFPAEDIRCVQQDGKIVFCESYKVWREE